MDSRLVNMLKGAKQVMNKVDENEGVSHPQNTSYSEGEKPIPNYNNVNSHQLLEHLPPNAHQNMNVAQPMGGGGPNEYAPRPVANTNPIQQTFKNLNTTKMPEAIVEAMVKNPIQQTGPKLNAAGMPTFDISDLPAELLRGAPTSNQVSNPVRNQASNQAPVNESLQTNTGQRMITMTEAELDARIQTALYKFMSETFTKTLTENTIKKTIGTLIKEGKINIKQKKKS